jgi:amidase
MGFPEIEALDATAQAELVRKKELKPIELIDAAIERVERLNPALNAVIAPMFERARDAAKSQLPDGPFRGVPFLLKDLMASYAGVPMSSGSEFLKDFVPDHDSELVARLKRAGLVIIGKTNTPEFGILPTTEPKAFGPTRNPWALDRTAGGSSGGSAAAVAAAMVPMAHGNDGGGSIRIPASCCGVFGMKPTRGRNSLAPDFGDVMNGLVVEHAVTLSVRDSAALLDATAGPVTGDPYFAPLPARLYVEEVALSPGRLRIAFTTAAPAGTFVHPDCVAAVHSAAKLCCELGHVVTEAAPAINSEMLIKSFLTVWSVGCAQALQGAAILKNRKLTSEQFEELTWALAEQGRATSAPAYGLAVNLLQRITRQVAQFFVTYDVWLTPTVAEPPPLLGSFDPQPGNPLLGVQRAISFVPFTGICNVTGQPAMSVPLFWSTDGLPIGTQFVGRYGEEGVLVRLAAQLEAAQPWAHQRPALQRTAMAPQPDWSSDG